MNVQRWKTFPGMPCNVCVSFIIINICTGKAEKNNWD